MERHIGPKEVENIREVESSIAGKKMLEKTARSVNTRLIYARSVLMFKEFMGKDLDSIVSEYQADVKENQYNAFEKWEEILEDYGRWLEKRLKGTSPTTYFQSAKNLINSNVPRSLRLQVKGPSPHPREIPPITLENLRKLRKTTDYREDAFIDVLKDSGVSRDDALEMNYEQVKKAIEDQTVQYLPIRMYRTKEDVTYTTWLGPNSLESLRLFFERRKLKGEQITDKSPVFASDMTPYDRLTGNALSQILRRLQFKTGIKVSTHRLRKFFETYIVAGSVHPVVAKYWMGHKIKSSRDVEARYIIPPEEGEHAQREQYMKAYAFIDLRETSEEVLINSYVAQISNLPQRAQAQLLEQIAARHGVKIAREVKARAPMPKLTKADSGLPASIYTSQRIVSEEELPKLLAEGWRVAAVLPSGKIVVSND